MVDSHPLCHNDPIANQVSKKDQVSYLTYRPLSEPDFNEQTSLFQPHEKPTCHHVELLIECFLARISAISPITIQSDLERRQAHLRIGEIAEIRAEPIKNPVTGEEHRARIVLPEGFEYKEAEMANAVMLRVRSEAPMVFEHENTYAQLHTFDWSNEGS